MTFKEMNSLACMFVYQVIKFFLENFLFLMYTTEMWLGLGVIQLLLHCFLCSCILNKLPLLLTSF
jgi:hypothetical protein